MAEDSVRVVQEQRSAAACCGNQVSADHLIDPARRQKTDQN